MIRDIIYWLGFSALSSCTLSTICTWFIYHYYNKYQADKNEQGTIIPMTGKFLDRCLFTLWFIFFIAMAADFKFLGPWQHIWF